MTVELSLYIGQQYLQDSDPAYLEALSGFNRQYGRSIHQIAYVDLSTVDRKLWELVEKYQQIQKQRFEENGEFWHITTSVQVDGDEKNLVEDSYGFKIPCIPLEEVRETILSIKGWAKYRRYALAMAIIDVMIEQFNDPDQPLVALAYGH